MASGNREKEERKEEREKNRIYLAPRYEYNKSVPRNLKDCAGGGRHKNREKRGRFLFGSFPSRPFPREYLKVNNSL